MRPSTFRRLGAALLLAIFIPSCTDTTPVTPALIPDGHVASKIAKTKDKDGREHHVQVETRGRYITRVSHDVDGKPFARLQYHYRAAPDGSYALERVTGHITWGGQTLDVGKHWGEIQAAVKAHGINPALLPAGAQAAALALDCWWEAAAFGATAAALAILLTGAPLLWPEILLAVSAYIQAAQAYNDCRR